MAQGTCAIGDCNKSAYCRTWCKCHYERWRLYGDPLGHHVRDDSVRFWAKVDTDGPAPARCPELGPCWVWTAGLDRDGYGQFRYKGGSRAHRFAYALLVHPIPGGCVIDHLCRNRACVNPAHLEPVTDRINILRGEAPPAVNATKDECIHGHEFTPENTKTTRDGKRQCRQCLDDAWARYHVRIGKPRVRTRPGA